MRNRISIFIFLVLAVPAFGKDEFTAVKSLDWLTGYTFLSIKKSALNPENKTLKLSEHELLTELRPNLKFSHNGDFHLIVRPKFQLKGDYLPQDLRPHRYQGEGKAEWREFYGSWTVSDHLTIAYGQQNFQWGPAELVSPTNRIVHENAIQKQGLYEIIGKHLARVNFTVGKNFSAIVLGETEPVKDSTEFGAGESFDKKVLTKLEMSSEGGDHYFGLVAGSGQTTKGWYGFYGNLAVTDAINLYTDSSLQKGDRAWRPEQLPLNPLISYRKSHLESPTNYWLAVTGLSLSGEKGRELRFEYLFNGSGYSKAERALNYQAAIQTPPAGAQSLAFQLNSGLEFQSQRLAYTSLRLSEFGPKDQLTWLLRYLRSIDDKSGVITSHLDWGLSDNAALFAMLSYEHGSEDTEFGRFIRWTAILGHKYTW